MRSGELVSVQLLSVSLSRSSPKVMGPFAAATIAAAGTALGLNKVVAKVTVQSSLLNQSDSF